MAVVELRGVTKRYGEHRAVDDVSLVIEHGLLVCLLGPSGCGKTTMLRLIAGFVAPDAGEIRVGEAVLSSPRRTVPPERRGMAMIFQSYALWPHMTVAQNVAHGLRLRRVPKGDIDRRVAAILAMTRLGDFAQRYPSELSGGQQQRVALARALVVEPETLLLDEPLSNLDTALREEMRLEIRRLHGEYRYTTVYVTHDHIEAMTAADLIVVMNAGRIEQSGTPQDIYREPRTQFVARFIGGANILPAVADGAGRAVIDGVPVRYERGGGASGATAVMIRHHDVRLDVPAPERNGANVLAGRVVAQSYLGASRDYIVALPSGVQVRAVTGPDADFAPGSEVSLHLPPERCLALPD